VEGSGFKSSTKGYVFPNDPESAYYKKLFPTSIKSVAQKISILSLFTAR